MSGRKNYILRVSLVLASAVFAMLAFWVVMDMTPPIDAPLSDLVSGLVDDRLTPIVIFITDIGDVQVLVPLTLGILFAFWMAKTPSVGLLVAGHLASSALICNLILKNIFARPRPSVVHMVAEHSHSFPSGHSFVGMAFYSLLIYIIIVRIKHPIKWLPCTALGLLILCIGLSRIYLGVHYPSDVLAGLCGGFVWTVATVHMQIVSDILKPQRSW